MEKGRTGAVLKRWVAAEGRFLELRVAGSNVVGTVEGLRAELPGDPGTEPRASAASTASTPSEEHRPGPLCANPGNIKVQLQPRRALPPMSQAPLR